VGTAKWIDDNPFGRNVVELPEFRPDSRERFGWSLKDHFKKPARGETLD
jgi:hypothetical protein